MGSRGGKRLCYDPMAQYLLTRLAVHSPDEKGYSLEQGLIKYNGKVWIAQNLALQTRLIAALHSSVVGGHSGMKATYYRLKKGFKTDRQFHQAVSSLSAGQT